LTTRALRTGNADVKEEIIYIEQEKLPKKFKKFDLQTILCQCLVLDTFFAQPIVLFFFAGYALLFGNKIGIVRKKTATYTKPSTTNVLRKT
jgi:hypothetical protein